MNWTAEQTREPAQRRLKKDAARRTELEERRAAACRHATELAQQIGAVEVGSIVAWKMSMQSEWKVDWVELGEQDESMVQSIMTSGLVLYER